MPVKKTAKKPKASVPKTQMKKTAPPTTIKKPKEAAKPSTSQEMPEDAVDLTTSTIKPVFDFEKKNLQGMFFKFLRVGVLYYLLLFAVFLFAGILTYLAFSVFSVPLSSLTLFVNYFQSNQMAFYALMLWLLFIGLLAKWLMSSISLTALLITKEQFEGTYSGIMSICSRIVLRVLGYLLLNSAIILLGLGIPLAIIILLMGNPAILSIGLIVYTIYAFLFFVLYMFFSQFWLWGLLANGTGIFRSLRDSFSLVRKNIFGVFVYDIMLCVAAIAMISPFSAAYSFLSDVLVLSINLGQAFMILGALLYLVLLLAIGVIFYALRTALILPYEYSFWKQLGRLHG